MFPLDKSQHLEYMPLDIMYHNIYHIALVTHEGLAFLKLRIAKKYIDYLRT